MPKDTEPDRTQPEQSRRDRSDLIDFSQDLKHRKSANNLLDLFDPLSYDREKDPNVSQGVERFVRARPSNRSAQTIELRKKDRRFRATSACPAPRNKQSTNLKYAREDFRRIKVYINSDVSTGESMNSTHNLDDLSLASTTATTIEDEISREINKLSLHSGSSITVSSKNSILGPNNVMTEKMKELFHQKDGDSNKLKLLRKHQRSGQEIEILTKKLKSFRFKYKHHDPETNLGLVLSPTLYSSNVRNMSVKLIITSPLARSPISFTCNASTTIEHLISHVVCTMFENLDESHTMGHYMLKATGKEEYFDSKLCLADYALVSHCWKLDLDVELTLLHKDSVKRPFLRCSKDDFQCNSLLCPDDLLSKTTMLRYSDLNYESLNIMIETFDREAQRLYSDVTNKSIGLQIQGLLQAAKAICSLMLNCETGQLSESKNNLAKLCQYYREEGNGLTNDDRYKMIEVIQHAIKKLMSDMRNLLCIASSSLPLDYEVDEPTPKSKKSFVDTPIDMIKDQVSLTARVLSQLRPEWLTRYKEFYLQTIIMHGHNQICPPVVTSPIPPEISYFPRLLFDDEMILSTSYSHLPREARLVISLIGIETTPNSIEIDGAMPIRRSLSATSVCSTAPMYSSSPRNSQILNSQKVQSQPSNTLLATCIKYLFDSESNLIQGSTLLPMHLATDSSSEDLYIETLSDRANPVLVIEFRKFPPEKRVFFPKHDIPEHNSNRRKKFEYENLESAIRFIIDPIINGKHSFENLMDDEKSLLWDNRQFLTSLPSALPKVLLSMPSWSYQSLEHAYELLNSWTPMNSVDALQLLLPSFPDCHIREMAIKWISKQHDDELCDYLPQLVQAFRYEKNIDCPLLWLLLDRAIKNVRIANSLYWHLKLNTGDMIFQDRSETIINCLLWISGSALWKAIDRQEDLLGKLASISNEIKRVRDGQRMEVLQRKLEIIQDYLMEKKPTLPWAPSLEICDLEVKSCHYFPSNTLPLKLAFRSCEQSCNKQPKFHTYDTLFKLGDDLRQDMLAIQIIRIMEKLWLKEGLDLRMVTFDCIATGERQGMVEMVQNAETLRKIHQNKGLVTGPFNSRAIDDYIRHWNTSELEYKKALDTFLHSCAGYCVATYILGICDRHNDNIMVTNSGHLFHIDYGKFLGDAQMMGSIKRDRTPFVLTADMAYVINGGDKPSKRFQDFVELCTTGFTIIRRHKTLFINLFSLMSSAKINGISSDSARYIDKMLMPDLTDIEASARFTRLIDECLSSRSTQVNFFIHNLAQLRFSGDNSKHTLLSFVPRTYSITTDGRIESLEMIHLYKKYEPEKQYYYVIRVRRHNQPDFTDINRTFREFLELQMKLNDRFPDKIFHDITQSSSFFLTELVGRNNTRETAQRRFIELEIFLKKLVVLPPEISECDLIYTFFHPILRDQYPLKDH